MPFGIPTQKDLRLHKSRPETCIWVRKAEAVLSTTGLWSGLKRGAEAPLWITTSSQPLFGNTPVALAVLMGKHVREETRDTANTI